MIQTRIGHYLLTFITNANVTCNVKHVLTVNKSQTADCQLWIYSSSHKEMRDAPTEQEESINIAVDRYDSKEDYEISKLDRSEARQHRQSVAVFVVEPFLEQLKRCFQQSNV